MDFYVYAICDPRAAFFGEDFAYKPIYIGKGRKNRYAVHLREAQGLVVPQHKNVRKLDAIKSIYESKNEPVVIFVAKNLMRDAAYDLERDLIRKYGRVDLDVDGILTNRIIDQRSLGGGKKGMKHQKLRSEEHRRKISTQRSGWIPSDSTRELWREQRVGRKVSAETKHKQSLSHRGANNPNAIEWIVTEPNGITTVVRGLRGWCLDKNFNYYDFYYNRKGCRAEKLGTGKGGRPKNAG